jgi:tripartite-type tricarboxylate transporter receptor subunit TctC
MHQLVAPAVCALLGFAGIASAQTDPIVVLTTYPATGSSSRATTLLAPKLEEFLGRDVQMEYDVGARGGVAAPADERTIFVSTIGNMALLPAISESFGIDPLTDLRPVTRLTAVPDVLIARSGLGIGTLDELLDYTRRHPGTLTYSYISPRSIHRVEFAALLSELGIDVTLDESVRSSAPAMEAIANGTVDLVITTSPYVSPLIESGAAVPLVIAHPTRIPLFPDVPTMLERGITDMPSGSWGGLFAPAGSSDAFVAQIFEAAEYAMKDPEAIQAINDLGMEVWPSESPDEFAEFIKGEMTRLGRAADKYGMQVD